MGERRVEGDGEELETAQWRERGAAADRDFQVEIWGGGAENQGAGDRREKVPRVWGPRVGGRGDAGEDVLKASGRAGLGRGGKGRKGPRRKSPLGPLGSGRDSTQSKEIAARRFPPLGHRSRRWEGIGQGSQLNGVQGVP